MQKLGNCGNNFCFSLRTFFLLVIFVFNMIFFFSDHKYPISRTFSSDANRACCCVTMPDAALGLAGSTIHRPKQSNSLDDALISQLEHVAASMTGGTKSLPRNSLSVRIPTAIRAPFSPNPSTHVFRLTSRVSASSLPLVNQAIALLNVN